MAQLGKKEFLGLVQEAAIQLTEGGKYTKKDAALSLDAVLVALNTALANGDNVALQGHGVYEVRERAEHNGRNPQTGESIIVPASKTVGFRATGIKNAVK